MGAVRRGLHVGIPDHALLQRLSCLQMPVFVANGESDPMILPHYSYLLGGLIPHARVKIYPDAAHGFLFQHHAEFAADVAEFLTASSRENISICQATRYQCLRKCEPTRFGGCTQAGHRIR